MANPRSIAARATQHPELDRSENLALDVSAEETPGADEVHDVALSVAVDGQLTRDGKFRWSAGWGVWVPTGKGAEHDLPGPLEFGPLLPDRLHPRGCRCIECWNAGVRYVDYLKAKGIRDANGF